MQAYAEGFDLLDKCEYELENAKVAHLWGQGSVVRSWLCELAARAFEADGNELAEISGYTEDSGEGRWTIADATAHDVPTPVITASLYARMYSRGNGDFTHRVLVAPLRNQFGGHAVKSSGKLEHWSSEGEPRYQRTRSSQGSSVCPSRRRRSSSSAPPATWQSANCCPRSTTSLTRALCHSAFTWSEDRAPGERRTTSTARSASRRSARFSRRIPDEDVLQGACSRTSATCPGCSTTTRSTQSLRKCSTSSRSGRAGDARKSSIRAFYLVDRPELLPVDRRATWASSGLAKLHDERRRRE